MSLTSYIFKPKHGSEVSKKIIEAFCSDYLGFGMDGLYLWWRENPRPELHPTPEGYVEFHIDAEGTFEHFTETSYSDEELTASQLAEDLYVMLGDDFWYDDTESGGKLYTFEDRELSEIVAALSAPGSRAVSFDCGREAFVCDVSDAGRKQFKRVDMLDYALTVPIVDKSQQQFEQLQLSL